MSMRMRTFGCRRFRFTAWALVLCMSLSGLPQVSYACTSNAENNSFCCCAGMQATPECCAVSQDESPASFPARSGCGCEANPVSLPQLVCVLESRVRDLLNMLPASAIIQHTAIEDLCYGNGKLHADSIAVCGRIVPVYQLGSVYRL